MDARINCTLWSEVGPVRVRVRAPPCSRSSLLLSQKVRVTHDLHANPKFAHGDMIALMSQGGGRG